MDKLKAKNVLHWIGFVAVIAGAIYIAFVAKGLGIVERMTLAATTLGGLFVALAKLFPVLDKAVDSLPDDPPVGPKAAAVLLLAGGLALSGAARAEENWLPLLPGTLGCFSGGKHCVRLSVPVGVVGLRARDGALGQVGFFPGASTILGLDLWAPTWHTLSPGVGGGVVKSTDGGPSYASISAVLGVCRYVTVGVSARWGEWRDLYVLYSVDPMALASLALPPRSP